MFGIDFCDVKMKSSYYLKHVKYLQMSSWSNPKSLFVIKF